jgi:transglutaminase-like putative cysteine protease
MLPFQSLTRSTRRQFVATSVVSVAGIQWAGRAGAQDSVDPSATTALQYQSPQIQNWRIGLVLDTPVTCTNVLATFVIPIDWPEQKVTVTGQQISPLVNAWKSRDLPTGARQIVLTMPRVPAGTTAEVTFTLQVERSRILGPDLTDGFVIPKRPSRDLRMFMGNSPFIDATDRRIKAASRDLAAVEVQSDWERVESIYDFVRENVEYVEGSLKNASDALKDGTGDCEEMTSLFVALCRNARIPARMVWIPDHCYPEFYLEDAEGNGHWFPCQAAGTRQFGRMDEYRPVLQKGDRFKVPEKKMPTRYLSEYFKCDKKGKGDPDPRFVREQIEI